jgi:transposase
LIQERSAAAQRIPKVLEDANVKLASVAMDVLGASGRDMLEALIAGEAEAAPLADRAHRRLRQKIRPGPWDGPSPFPGAHTSGCG